MHTQKSNGPKFIIVCRKDA